MKIVILAGGYGTRISEESHLKPKPMIEIGELPIIVHIMKVYAAQGFKEFIICAGYKQHIIKEYFSNYFLYNSDVTFDMKDNACIFHNKPKDEWKVTVVDTGLQTMTGGRVKRIKEYIGNEPFMLTYGDAVGDIDMAALLASHKKSGKLATMTCYNLGQNKGIVEVANGSVKSFREKDDEDGDLINVGFMVCESGVMNYIEGDATVFEQAPLKSLVADNQLNAYIHRGFWQCMDTLREKEKLDRLWVSGAAPWKIWKD